jgi:hypothetical protein
VRLVRQPPSRHWHTAPVSPWSPDTSVNRALRKELSGRFEAGASIVQGNAAPCAKRKSQAYAVSEVLWAKRGALARNQLLFPHTTCRRFVLTTLTLVALTVQGTVGEAREIRQCESLFLGRITVSRAPTLVAAC